MARRQNVVRLERSQEQTSITLPTPEELALKYEENLKRRGLSKFSIKHERENLRAILKLLPPGVHLCTLSYKDLECLVFDVMRRKGLKPVTINGRIKSLRRFLSFLVGEGLILTNEANRVQKLVKTHTDIPSLTKEQVVALLNQPDLNSFTGYRDFVIMKIMLDNGIRLREILDLLVGQIDLKERFIRGIVGKNRYVEDIPISKEVCKDLKLYLSQRGSLDVDEVFVTVDNRPLNRRTFQERMQKYGDMAGIRDVRVSPHTLRHTFAKQWILNGGDVFSLQKILRHSTMEMVRRYVSLWGHEVQKQHDRFSPVTKMHLDHALGLSSTSYAEFAKFRS